MKVAVVFPGQGSQNTSMLDSFEENLAFKNVIDEGSDILDYNISSVINDEQKINNTLYTQPLVLTVSYAIWKTLSTSADLHISMGAGHSLGEYTALVANGSLSFKEGLLLVKKRAELMSNAMEHIDGAMAAVIGIEGDSVDKVCKQETKAGRDVRAEWSWIVPPISGSATSVFHERYNESAVYPNFLLQVAAWETKRGQKLLASQRI